MKFLGEIDSSQLILLDVKYSRKVNDEGKKTDYAMFLMKNAETGEKRVFNVEHPEMEIFFTKQEYRNYNYNLSHISKSKVDSVIVPYKKVLNTIVKDAGGDWKRYYDDCIGRQAYRALNNIHRYNYVFGSDLDLDDFYRCMWNIYYYNPDLKVELTKSFLDIEVDGIETTGVPLNGVAPINAVSYTDAKTKTCYSFLIRQACKDNPQIQEFEDNIDDFYKLCHETFDEEYPGFKYKVFMFDDELVMIKALFQLIRNLDRDFCAIWNMGYDIPYFIARINELGGDPVEIMCDDRFAVKELFYWADRGTGVVVQKKDYFKSSSGTIFTDAMLNYGKLRKGKVIPSLKLNRIAHTELDSSKLDYSDEADIKTLPYVNYKKFVLYNMKDTLLLYAIENKTEDIDNLYSSTITNGCSYKAAFSPTKFLRTRFYIECWKDGYISGNNANVDYAASRGSDDDDDGVKYDGAVVGDPKLNAHVGESIFGKPSKYVFKYVVDMDFSSMYPWSIITFNISPDTMIGKLFVDKSYFHGEVHEGDMDEPTLKFEPGKQFIEDYLSKDFIKMGNNWFGLPPVTEMIADLDNKKPSPETIDCEFEMPSVFEHHESVVLK